MSSNEPKRRRRRASSSRAQTSATQRLRTQAGEVTNDLQDMASIAGDVVQENLENVRERAADYYERGRDHMHSVERNFEHYIREQPLRSILIAAVVGMFLGRFGLRR